MVLWLWWAWRFGSCTPVVEALAHLGVLRALATLEKALGSEHPKVATSLENYAALLRETGRGAEATKMEARVEAIRAKHAR